MQKTLKSLEKSKVVKNYIIIDARIGAHFYYLKIKANLIDDSVLFIREFVSDREYLYSYHWQDRNGKLRIRWDNAPHHKHVKTYPHHKHTPEVLESYETTLDDVLDVIEKIIAKREK